MVINLPRCLQYVYKVRPAINVSMQIYFSRGCLDRGFRKIGQILKNRTSKV